MMSMVRNIVAVILIAFVGFGTLLTPSSVTAQVDIITDPVCVGDVFDCCDTNRATETVCGLFDDMGQCAALYGLDYCAHAADAFLWAGKVTDWKFPGARYVDAGMGNAFKHCAWIGALATRIGSSDAYTVGFIHESRLPPEDPNRLMDDMNNYIGAGIGGDAVESGVSDQWKYVLDECESRAKGFQLYGPGGIQGNYPPHPDPR